MRHGTCINCGRLRELTRSLECRSCVGDRSNSDRDDWTEEELEAMIAEQLPTIPPTILRESAVPKRAVKLSKRTRGENVA